MMRPLWIAAIAALSACGSQTAETEPRDDRPHPIRTVKPSEAELHQELTPEQYNVTQRGDTEPPFHNAYWNNHVAGLYVDVTTGQPLFISKDKFESGTGWPSFTRPISPDAVVEHHDGSLGMDRVEVRSKIGDAHLGHVFDDGPRPTGLRYCINSASLRFIPVDQLATRGYAKYRELFDATAR